MDAFITETDELGILIEAKCKELYAKMQSLNPIELGLSPHGIDYFTKSHLTRLFFSIETSAHLLYKAIKLSGQKVSEIVVMDYGAGIGSLYLLAKMIGCKQVIYNDLLDEWRQNALKIASALQIEVDKYLVGNIDETLKELAKENIELTIITSRNVIEHIYELEAFYNSIYQSQPNCIIYSSTTANFHNPAMNLQHVLLHRKWRTVYEKMRLNYLIEKHAQVAISILTKIAKKTNGYRFEDLDELMTDYHDGENIWPIPTKYVYTNTCEPQYGVWAENIIPFQLHKIKGAASGYDISIYPGFWDTHYQQEWKKRLGKWANNIAVKWPLFKFTLAPFIYVVAVPKLSTSE